MSLPDALARHLAASDAMDWAPTEGPVAEALARVVPATQAIDAHAHFIATVDARDPLRAARMLDALTIVRRRARDEEPSAQAIAEVQEIVLGHAAPLRREDAWAKGGRERSALPDGLARLWSERVALAADPRVPVLSRAVRAYLDTCFVHPFEDGNARAARLLFEWVVTRAGLAPRGLAPIFTLPRIAGDARGYVDLLRLACVLFGPGRGRH